jgi:hypothetical protein
VNFVLSEMDLIKSPTRRGVSLVITTQAPVRVGDSTNLSVKLSIVPVFHLHQKYMPKENSAIEFRYGIGSVKTIQLTDGP